MTCTRILLFHPGITPSRANAALAEAARTLPGVEIIDMAARHPNGQVEANDDDVALLLSADRIVLQFPIHWYAPPPLVQAWQNAVLTRMFYINEANEGARLKGIPLLVAATAGNVPEAYTPAGVNLFPLDELLRPLEATASRCGLAWSHPFLLFRANRLDDAALVEAGGRYADHLERWIASTPRR
jgi:putative NADPH-quinone reductase